jgi:hypothetical protein
VRTVTAMNVRWMIITINSLNQMFLITRLSLPTCNETVHLQCSRPPCTVPDLICMHLFFISSFVVCIVVSFIIKMTENYIFFESWKNTAVLL